MKLYEIPQMFTELYERLIGEDGEVDQDVVKEMEDLGVQKADKELNTALYIKTLNFNIKAFEEEERRVKKKKESLVKSRDYLKSLLASSLGGEKIDTPQVSVSYKKSESVKVSDGFIDYAREHNLKDYYKETIDYKVKKAEIKEKLKEGEEIPYCELEIKQNIQIK